MAARQPAAAGQACGGVFFVGLQGWRAWAVLHCADTPSTHPLPCSRVEWRMVLLLSASVVLVDEVLELLGAGGWLRECVYSLCVRI
jgi:hypothetical protein